jgi:hypothetical protein
MDSQFKDDASRYLHNLTIFRVGAARMFGDVLEIRPNPLKNLSVGVGVSPVDGRSRKESPKRTEGCIVQMMQLQPAGVINHACHGFRNDFC